MTEQDKPRWIKTAKNRTAVIMLMTGILAAALFIAALAGGFEGWAWIAGIVTLVLLGGGGFFLRSGARTPVAQQPVVYHPDSPDVVVDVDRDTGERTRHED